VTAQARYTGTGKLSKQNGWLAPGDSTWWTLYVNDEPSTNEDYPLNQPYDPDVERTVSSGDTPSWTTLNLNFSYDFGRSRLQLDRFESLNAYFNIENVGDRIPTFFSGTGAGGINSALYSALGRQFRMGVRMAF
jgi:outer membrane receptor for Fe3+-dicitrate